MLAPFGFLVSAQVPSTVLAAPVISMTNYDQGGVTIAWDAVVNALTYEFWRGSPSLGLDWEKLTTTASTSYLDSTVAVGQEYTFEVRARNGQVVGPMSNRLDLTF